MGRDLILSYTIFISIKIIINLIIIFSKYFIKNIWKKQSGSNRIRTCDPQVNSLML
jgi:hypothetical protein